MSHQADLLFWYQRNVSLQWDIWGSHSGEYEEMSHHAVWQKITGVLAHPTPFIFRAEQQNPLKHLFLQNKQSISLNVWNTHSSTLTWKVDFAVWQYIISHSTSANYNSLCKFRVHQAMKICLSLALFSTSCQLCLTSPLLSITDLHQASYASLHHYWASRGHPNWLLCHYQKLVSFLKEIKTMTIWD
jgi:hypothetical protein